MRMVNIEISEDFFQRLDEAGERQALEEQIIKFGAQGVCSPQERGFCDRDGVESENE